MAKYSEPKDYMLGRKAYKAYFDGVAIEFTDLSHNYQMRWVNVARAVTGEVKRLSPNKSKVSPVVVKPYLPPDNRSGGSGIVVPHVSDEELLKDLPRKPSGRIDYDLVPEELHDRVKKAATNASKRRYSERQKKT